MFKTQKHTCSSTQTLGVNTCSLLISLFRPSNNLLYYIHWGPSRTASMMCDLLSRYIATITYSTVDTPRLIESLRGKKVVDAACGSSHSACILDDGSLYTWGKGRYGRLGHNDFENQVKPKQVSKVVMYVLTGVVHKYDCSKTDYIVKNLCIFVYQL